MTKVLTEEFTKLLRGDDHVLHFSDYNIEKQRFGNNYAVTIKLLVTSMPEKQLNLLRNRANEAKN